MRNITLRLKFTQNYYGTHLAIIFREVGVNILLSLRKSFNIPHEVLNYNQINSTLFGILILNEQCRQFTFSLDVHLCIL
jgi:hypothetical protein